MLGRALKVIGCFYWMLFERKFGFL